MILGSMLRGSFGEHLSRFPPKTFAASQTIERNLEAMALKCWSNASPADFALAFKAEVDNAEKVFMQA
jgi:hypothetical protein